MSNFDSLIEEIRNEYQIAKRQASLSEMAPNLALSGGICSRPSDQGGHGGSTGTC
jgi:hypothetical protein